MVKITNGKDVYEVTSGAFKNVFSQQGYKIVSDSDNRSENTLNNKVLTASEKFCEEMSEKPISQWSQEELKKFTEIKNIDISSAKKVSEVREIVKKYLENN